MQLFAKRLSLTSPWLWVPTLYLMEGIPNCIVEGVAPAMLKGQGFADAQIAPLVATAALPWALKPFWSPLLVFYKTKRFWVWFFQFALAGAFLATGALVFQGVTPAVIMLVLGATAFFSASHDVAADGFYLYGLDKTGQDAFVGVRNTIYRLAGLVFRVLPFAAAGLLATRAGLSYDAAWGWVFAALAVLAVAAALWHLCVLPKPPDDVPTNPPPSRLVSEFVRAWVTFFKIPNIGVAIAFLLLFRLTEVQVTRISPLFLKASLADGGLGLGDIAFGSVQGGGSAGLILGGVLGGVLAACCKLRYWLWPVVFAMHLPNLAYVALAHWQPESLWWVSAGVSVEMFGYGLGYTVVTLVMLRICAGPFRAAHFSFATGLAYLGSLLPGYWVGRLTSSIGYETTLWLVMLCALPGLAITWLAQKKLLA